MYLLVTVISNGEKIRPVLKALKSIGIKGILVIDSMGSTNIDNNYSGYRPAIESTLISISELAHYKKTIFSIIESEETVNAAMDTIEKVLGNNMKKPNTGIMFTIPMIGFRAGDSKTNIELGKCCNED